MEYKEVKDHVLGCHTIVRTIAKQKDLISQVSKHGYQWKHHWGKNILTKICGQFYNVLIKVHTTIWWLFKVGVCNA